MLNYRQTHIPQEANAMARRTFDEPTNPYHYTLHCIGGKWKMTILHEIHTYGNLKLRPPKPGEERVFFTARKDA